MGLFTALSNHLAIWCLLLLPSVLIMAADAPDPDLAAFDIRWNNSSSVSTNTFMTQPPQTIPDVVDMHILPAGQETTNEALNPIKTFSLEPSNVHYYTLDGHLIITSINDIKMSGIVFHNQADDEQVVEGDIIVPTFEQACPGLDTVAMFGTADINVGKGKLGFAHVTANVPFWNTYVSYDELRIAVLQIGRVGTYFKVLLHGSKKRSEFYEFLRRVAVITYKDKIYTKNSLDALWQVFCQDLDDIKSYASESILPLDRTKPLMPDRQGHEEATCVCSVPDRPKQLTEQEQRVLKIKRELAEKNSRKRSRVPKEPSKQLLDKAYQSLKALSTKQNLPKPDELSKMLQLKNTPIGLLGTVIEFDEAQIKALGDTPCYEWTLKTTLLNLEKFLRLAWINKDQFNTYFNLVKADYELVFGEKAPSSLNELLEKWREKLSCSFDLALHDNPNTWLNAYTVSARNTGFQTPRTQGEWIRMFLQGLVYLTGYDSPVFSLEKDIADFMVSERHSKYLNFAYLGLRALAAPDRVPNIDKLVTDLNLIRKPFEMPVLKFTSTEGKHVKNGIDPGCYSYSNFMTHQIFIGFGRVVDFDRINYIFDIVQSDHQISFGSKDSIFPREEVEVDRFFIDVEKSLGCNDPLNDNAGVVSEFRKPKTQGEWYKMLLMVFVNLSGNFCPSGCCGQ